MSDKPFEIKVIPFSRIKKCRRKSLLPSHYRKDGTCKCQKARKS